MSSVEELTKQMNEESIISKGTIEIEIQEYRNLIEYLQSFRALAEMLEMEKRNYLVRKIDAEERLKKLEKEYDMLKCSILVNKNESEEC